ncbi:endonuclease MutS2 [Ancylothrix sp. C2]|uniref:endonuclease MutS2 n=1 Tax=Ancylothrix sp. D3o TaxID=2953691 RepID=UPI0021BA56ED|nr:endonuclease MutS2 [Ancylothrix sp. D3o]MCT7951675.1 endonuclease MutS2 [Ancylothrix sp. D3o]
MIQTETLDLLEWPRLCQHLATFAATKLGAKAATQLIIPNTPEQTQHLLAQTKETYELENRLPSGLTFDGIYDIGESIARAEIQGVLLGEELLEIATTLAGVRRLRRTIDNYSADVPVLASIVQEARTYPEIEQEIHRCIDERGKVTDRASPKLGEIRNKLRSARDKIYQTLQGILQRQSNAVQEQLITQRGDRFVIPVKASHKDSIRGIVHDTSASGATLYIEPHAIIEQNNHLRQLEKQEQAEEEAVRRNLSHSVGEVKPDLEKLLSIATDIDLATAKARYSFWLQANPPHFIEWAKQSDTTINPPTENSKPKSKIHERITLRKLRHPLLVWQQQHEQGPSVVPVDIIIQPQIRVVAITGPNTGGKTVTLKTLGLAVLMAKVGLFIPASEPVELPWFDNVLADIGDEQSIEQSLSTFSGHIRRISRILDAATENSLVLLDEVGAGTDPSEGSALAIALLEYLASHIGLSIATTHFGELKALKYQDERFENASVEFDDISLSPTYRLLWGIPGRSNALTIARRLGLKEDIVQTAQSRVGASSGEEINSVIAGLEQSRRNQETKAKEAADLLKQTELLHKELSQKSSELQQREQQLKLSQEIAVTEAISTAKAEIARVIRRLQQGTPTGQDAQQATANIDQVAEQYLPSRKAPPRPKPGFMPKVGDRLRIPRLGQTAEVLSAPDESGNLTVRFGIMKMSVSLADVESLDGEKAEMPVKTKPHPSAEKTGPTPDKIPVQLPTVRTSKNTVDIRGSRVSDAESQLERAIVEAVPTSGALWIVHGKGTGKLRQGVHEFLQHHPQVSRYELAANSEGGAGVTVAFLK